MNILMTGPGRGQNIKPWFDYFENQNEHKLYFFSEGNFEFKNDYKNIEVVGEIIGLRKEQIFFKAYNLLKNVKIDAIHVHGLYYAFWPFVYFQYAKNARKVIEIWSHKIIEDYYYSTDENVKKAYEFALENTDSIVFGWWSTYNLFLKLYPQYADKASVILDGRSINSLTLEFDNEYLRIIKKKYNVFDEDKVIVSTVGINENHNIDLIIKGLALIKNTVSKDLFSKIKLIIRNGTTASTEDYLNYLNDLIIKNNLTENIYLNVTGEFVEFKEIMALHKLADMEFIILNHDMLTNNIIEAISMDSIVFLSDIESYRIFKEKYNLPFKLIKPNIENIAECILEIIKMYDKKYILDKQIKDKIINDFTFENRVKSFMKLYRRDI